MITVRYSSALNKYLHLTSHQYLKIKSWALIFTVYTAETFTHFLLSFRVDFLFLQNNSPYEEFIEHFQPHP